MEDFQSLDQDNKPTKWENEIDLEKNSFTIRFNKPQKAANAEETKYTESIVVDRRILVEELKKRMAIALNEPLDKIIFRRGGNHGAELIEDDLPFKLANIYNMMSMFVEYGEPTRAGYKRIKFFMADYYNPDWSTLKGITDDLPEDFRAPYDYEFLTFTELFKQPTRTQDKVVELKQKLMTQINELFPNIQAKNPNYTIRLREKLADKLCAVYHNEKILGSYGMHDDKEIVVQILP